MKVSSRREVIRTLLGTKPFISLEELEEAFPEVSSMTLRRDIEYFETNLNLETNVQVLAQWKYFDAEQHKRRRSYIKNIK